MRQLSGQDALFLHLEKGKTPMHIGGLYFFDSETETFNLESFKQFFRERLHLTHIFRQRLLEVPMDMGHPFWVDDPDFDLDNHIKHIDLGGKASMADLAALAGEVHSKKMDRNKPLWENTFITGFDIPGYSKNAFAMIANVHHAAIDGGSGVEIMASLLSMSEEPFKPKQPKEPWSPKPLPSAMGLIAKSYGGSLDSPKKFFNFVKNTAAKAFDVKEEIAKNLIEAPTTPFSAPTSLLNEPINGKKVIGAVDISLKEVKKLKNTVPGATVNDVLLAVCSGGIRKYLVKRGRLPMKDLVAMCPISVRQQGEKGEMGNKVSAMLVKLGTSESDPIERMKIVNQNTRNSKTYSKAMPADQIMEFVPSEVASMAGRVYLKMGLSKIHRPFFNLVITNVPGPPIPLYMNRFKMKGLYGLGATLDWMGVMMVIFSYAGNISLTITADEGVVPDMPVFTESLRESLSELQDAVATMAQGGH